MAEGGFVDVITHLKVRLNDVLITCIPYFILLAHRGGVACTIEGGDDVT